MIRIAQAIATEGLKLRLTFENGVSGTVDFSELAKSTLFAPLTMMSFLKALALSGTAEL
ncbi:DUF2442 domain-containing protein [Mesotoga prima]|uniref:DUF2442 domain-containing protein n=1 Tax=Mesotoga prima TaxID=1184387 RepID=UPI0001E4F0E4|nr:DUF2442 domain-containing protein [Mesotoga prima]